ncbi:MAG TPA: ABC transporter ATP-binding protein [Candidatus Omnitrophica bacterium]|nr:ABC transporter ATP-binding protein [Candidatus Omnitrophota bacterium]
MKEYFKLLKFVKKEIGLLILAFICMGISTIFNGASLGMIIPVADKVLTNKKIIVPHKLPDFLNSLIDKINSLEPLFLLKVIAFSIVVLFILKGLFVFLQGFLMEIVGLRAVVYVRTLLYKKFQELSLDFYSQKRAGELISRITNDAGLLKYGLTYGLTDLIYQSMQLAMFVFIVFYIHPKLALISFIIFPIIIFPVMKVGRKLKKLSSRSQEKMADLNAILSETISGAKIVKAFHRQDYEIEKFKKIVRDYYKFLLKSAKRQLLLSPFTEFIGALAAIAIFLLGGKDVIEGKLSFGVFGFFLGSLMSMIRPFKKLTQVHAINQQALAASQRIYEILEKKPSVEDRPQAIPITALRDKIEFKEVWFKYHPEEDFVLKDINLVIKAGETVALVGPTGSGKTTIFNLLLRFYEVTQGRILFDGVDIRDIKLSSLREMTGLVTQEPVLFNDTVRANIAYGKLSASREEIESAAKRALAYDFIKELPSGWDTVIGDKGFRLSGGQKQRLCIARAILKNPQLLLLDEATAQLDSESENLVQKALDNLMQGKTVLVIAHRLSTVKKASKIVVIDKGAIVGEGKHSDLLNNCDLYRKLYEFQFSF